MNTNYKDARKETLHDGTRVLIRQLLQGDIEMERKFIEQLSPESRRFRFLDSMRSPSNRLLEQLLKLDQAAGVAYVAVVDEGVLDHEVGVARFSLTGKGHECEFAVVVADKWQRQGLGTLLVNRLVAEARFRGILSMHSDDSHDNEAMRQFAASMKFERSPHPQDPAMVVYTATMGADENPTAPLVAGTLTVN